MHEDGISQIKVNPTEVRQEMCHPVLAYDVCSSGGTTDGVGGGIFTDAMRPRQLCAYLLYAFSNLCNLKAHLDNVQTGLIQFLSSAHESDVSVRQSLSEHIFHAPGQGMKHANTAQASQN